MAIEVTCEECGSDLDVTITIGDIEVEPCSTCQGAYNEVAKKMISENVARILTKNGVWSEKLITAINTEVHQIYELIDSLPSDARDEYNDSHEDPMIFEH
jgi:DnaJ-class molecular chaperone